MAFLNLIKSITEPKAVSVFDASPPAEVQPFDLIEAMNKKLSSIKVTPISTETTIFRSSGLSKLCSREEVLRNIFQVQKTERIHATLQITFDFGNAFHNLVQQEWFGKWGWLVGDWQCVHCQVWVLDAIMPKNCESCAHDEFKYRELEVLDRDGISGHTDGILQVDGARRLLELKTCNSKVYDYVTNVLGRPTPAHDDQAQIYMKLFNAQVASVVYLNKDTSERTQYHRVYNALRAQILADKPKEIRHGIKTKTAPPRTVCEKIDCARAKACPVRKICFEQ